MVYLALKSEAALEAIKIAKQIGASVWVGSDAITPEESRQFWDAGVKLTVFDYALSDAPPAAIEDALSTIQEHHPGEVIWIQHIPVA